jgi:hypothetical protein
MLRFLTAAASWCAALVLLADPASAQWFSQGMNDCNCAPAMSASYAATAYNPCAVCAPVVQTVCAPAVQPVMQTVYKQVPVVEYQAAKQIVKKPVVEVKYVDQAVTEYRPITETKIAEVPTVTYQDVTECQTVYRNMGYWRTKCEPNYKMSACQYDGRSGMVGWLNRTGYEMRSAMTPAYRTSREYVPQTIAQQVPTTRRVAINGTRQVSYNVTTMVAHQTTRKVAQNSIRYEDAEITVMKTMAVGTQVTYQPIGGTATAQQPVPDATINARGTSPKRTATDDLDKSDPNRVNRKTGAGLHQPPVPREKLVPTSYPQFTADTPLVRSPVAVKDAAGEQPAEKPFTAPTAARAWVARSGQTKPTSSDAATMSVARHEQP